ncbi:hypothetical protein C8J56DRAFT_993487 [Mycena floridula]|nr:hypothetical protein C8J56DRAFT_993487 [Mycena floridula]
MESNTKIAIVGIACDLPGPNENLDHNQFYNFLLEHGQSYSKIPAERFNIEGWRGTGAGQIAVDTGSFLKDIEKFDNLEFGLSTHDSRSMAVATRKLIESSFLALLDSGIQYRAKNVGCYMAGNSVDLTNVSEPDEYDARGAFSGSPAMVANRVSYALDLLGPSVPTDTACSSTATALHLAVQAIRNGDCESAIVGGCQINHRLIDWVNYSAGSLLAKDGKCKPFDASADGFSRAEGCVVIVIKPFDDAVRDHDHIYATILSTAINSSGSGAPAGAPVAERQRDAMLDAFKRASRIPQDVDYIELHATGTAKGDPTEANWVGQHFSRDRELIIGSVKGNIGHTEITALLASLSKVISIFEHKIIPPNVNLETPNPAIHWEKYNLFAPTEPRPLPCHQNGQSLISLAASGIGGLNGHVVLEGPSSITAPFPQEISAPQGYILLMAGGLTPRTATATAEHLTQMVSSSSSYSLDLATLLGRRSKQMTWRTYAVISPQSLSANFPPPILSPREPRKIVFVFSGQGPQHIDSKFFPAFRASVLEMDAVFQSSTGTSLIHDYGLFKTSDKARELSSSWPISIILPSIAIFQMALYDLVTSMGIIPEIVVGHSAGETAVLYASGAATKAMALELAVIRGRVLSSLEAEGGTMAALSCSAERASELITMELASNPGSTLDIACYNSPSDVAIAGHARALKSLVELAQSQGILGRMIRTNVPIHSSMVDACKEQYLAEVGELFDRYSGPHIPTLTTFSTLTGQHWTNNYDAEYFWQGTRNPVMFSSTMSSIQKSADCIFVEIAPHPVLSAYLTTICGATSHVLSLVRRPKAGSPSTEYIGVLDFCGQLTMHGSNCVDFTGLFGKPTLKSKSALPPYPFSKKSFPLYPDTAAMLKQMSARLGPLNHGHLRLNKTTHPMLGEHNIRGEPIMPAAGFLEMGLEFGASVIMNVKLLSILSLSSSRPTAVKVNLDGCHWTVSSVNYSSAGFATERLHADGYLSFEDPPPVSDLNLMAIRQQCPNYVGGRDLYKSLLHAASYGPSFQKVLNIHYGHRELLASIKGTDSVLGSEGYVLHPTILDACFHVFNYRPFHGDFNENVYNLPANLKYLVLHRPWKKDYFPKFIYVHMTLETWSPGSTRYDLVLADEFGSTLCTIRGLEVARHRITPLPTISHGWDLVYQPIDPRPDLEPNWDESTTLSNVERGTVQALSHNPTSLYTKHSFTFNYCFGDEIGLQWNLSGLHISQKLEVWILADHPAALGLTRAIRREYPAWCIWLVLFPESFTDPMRRECIRELPRSFFEETEIIITDAGEPTIPRMVPLSKHITARPLAAYTESGSLSPHRILGHSSGIAGVSAFLDRQDSTTAEWVVGLTTGEDSNDASFLIPVPAALGDYHSLVIAGLPSLVTAILSLGLSRLRSEDHSSLKVLLTHSDTVPGYFIDHLFASQGHRVQRLKEATDLLTLSTIGCDYDLVISGSHDHACLQILKTLINPQRGTWFLWGQTGEGLSKALAREPYTVRDAMHEAVVFLNAHFQELHPPYSHASLPILSDKRGPVLEALSRVQFYAHKTYLIIGGIGHIGGYVALYLYQHGARNITLTSRLGRKSLLNATTIVRRIFAYLDQQSDLHLQYEVANGASESEMRSLVDHLSPPPTACFILTGVLYDGPFATRDVEQFEQSFSSKVTVLETLRKTINLSSLDFIVAFSSVAGFFGNANQSPYASANSALESMIESIPNAFSFICPGLLDSTMMRVGTKGSESRNALSNLISWALTTEDMMEWLNDAILQFCRGVRFSRYLPDLNWAKLDQDHGMPPLGRHLVPKEVYQASDSDNANNVSAENEQVKDIIQQTLNIATADFGGDIPLMSYGLDSLLASRISFLLRSFVQLSQIQLLADISFNDILEKMGLETTPDTLISIATDHSRQDSQSFKGPIFRRWLLTLRDAIASRSPTSVSTGGARPSTVVVTGTTGFLGSYILQQLLLEGTVQRVYALNRKSDLGMSLLERQTSAFSKHGLPPSLAMSSKLILIECDLARPDLGMSHAFGRQVPWKLNFGTPLADYEGLIQGTINLLLLAAESEASFSFLSTTGIYHGLNTGKPGPESGLENPTFPLLNGYLQSKWLAERLVHIASEELGISSTVIRTGLLTGGSNGCWDTSHWLPAIVQSGLYVGCLPAGDGTVSWIPVEVAARAIVDCQDAQHDTVHIVHPQPTTWNSLMAPMARSLNVLLVPYEDWFARLEDRAKTSFSLDQTTDIPALKLLDFFRPGPKTIQPTHESMGLMPVVESSKGLDCSLTLRDPGLGPIDAEEVGKWISYWRSVGFLGLE